MIYHTVCILLCVPFWNQSDTEEAPHATDQQTKVHGNDKILHDVCKAKAMTICRNSAKAMCIVAQKYRQRFGSFKLSPITPTHCILSAALVIIGNCRNDPHNGIGSQLPRGPSPQTALGLCLEVLRELSTSWNIAKRIGRNLEKLYCRRLNCDIEDVPAAPSFECNLPCTTSSQPTELDVCGGHLTPQPDAYHQFGLQNLVAHDTFLTPSLPNIDADASENTSEDQMNNGDGIRCVPNPNELFVNNLGFAFAADSLPSDYTMFDTLNQMYSEDMGW